MIARGIDRRAVEQSRAARGHITKRVYKTQMNPKRTMMRMLGISFHTAATPSPSRGTKKKAQSVHLMPKPNQRTARDAAFVRLTMSRRSLLATHLVVIILSFVAGRLLRTTLLSLSSLPPPRHGVLKMNLPGIRPTRKIPTNYSFMHSFDGITAASDSVFIVQHPETCSINSAGQQVCYQEDEGDWEAPPPSAEHLLVDLEHVDYAFLNSEERLAEAMLQVVNASNISLLSYHCHRLDPHGVSCVGVSLLQHVSLHTWPEAGVITLDLFSTESGSLLHALPVFKDMFGVPSTDMADVEMKWVIKPRGFGQKKPTSSLTLHRSTLVDESSDDSYDETKLDLTMQDDFQTDHAYYEALVHPVLTISPEPWRVAVIGGGVGAALREVLKHNRVEQVVMVDESEELVDFSHENIHDRHYCGDLFGRPEWCYMHPGVQFHYENPISWAVDKYLEDAEVWLDDQFDVILIDNPDTDFFEALHSSTDLTAALYASSSAQGILVMPLKERNSRLHAAPLNYVHDGRTARMLSNLHEAGFEIALTYTESSVRGGASQQFLVAFVDYSARAAWFQNEAEVATMIRYKAVFTMNGESPFRYFDGATMMPYKFPTRAEEEMYCRQDPKPVECGSGHGYDPFSPNAPITGLSVKTSEIHEDVGLGVFTDVPIPKGSYIGLESCVRNEYLLPSTTALYELFSTLNLEKMSGLYYYVSQFGCGDLYYGKRAYNFDLDIMVFTNHGCRGSYNIGTSEVTELDIGDEGYIDESEAFDVPGKMYRPWSDRHYPMPGCFTFKARRDIRQGEEMLDNYLTYAGTHDPWALANMAHSLRGMCVY